MKFDIYDLLFLGLYVLPALLTASILADFFSFKEDILMWLGKNPDADEKDFDLKAFKFLEDHRVAICVTPLVNLYFPLAWISFHLKKLMK